MEMGTKRVKKLEDGEQVDGCTGVWQLVLPWTTKLSKNGIKRNRKARTARAEKKERSNLCTIEAKQKKKNVMREI